MFCGECGSRLDGGGHCPNGHVVLAIVEQTPVQHPGPVALPPPSIPPTSPLPPPAAAPPQPPPSAVPSMPTQPPGTAYDPTQAQVAYQANLEATSGPPLTQRRSSVLPWIGLVAAVALVGVGAFILTRALSNDDAPDDASGSTLDEGPSSSEANTGGSEGTTNSSVDETQSTDANTNPPTDPPTVPPTTEFDPAAVPTIPAVTPVDGPGNLQLLSNPLPSGLRLLDIRMALPVAQNLADALAGENWDVVRAIDTDKAGLSDADFAAGYTGLDRASVMVVDAREEGDDIRLLFVSVANELNGARTSLYCLEWTVDPVARTVRQNPGVVGRIARVETLLSPEAVRNDPGLMATIASECVWS